ncbi:MAG: nucleotidyltransferase domain-containing protein [Chloroflexi bacterium]|nr:nucleotidyltransferase domain-containing protein [Chloroflexota bacterium]
MLGVRSINTVKRLIRANRLTAIRPGGHYRVARADVERLRNGPINDPREVNRTALRRWAEDHRVDRLILFGSAARGDMHRFSDVDLAFVLESGHSIGLFEHVRMQHELADLFGVPVDLGSLRSLRPSIRERVDVDGVTLYENG